jgi:uncharacterized protein YdhG (YjbR/CyaY superfamily)
MRGPPEPEEELTGELGDLDVSGSVAFDSVMFARLLRYVNNLCYKLYSGDEWVDLTTSTGVSMAESTTKSKGFTDEERAAMKERAKELKAEARRGGKKGEAADGERDVLAKIAEMKGKDRAMAKRLHAIVKDSAPDLSPRTWYGMPAYAKDGKVVCFFQSAAKFKSRYATIGFSDKANLDKGVMWPTSFALKDLTAAEEKKMVALVKKAVS